MIHRIFSNLPKFKELEFSQGLNVLVAQKEHGATEKQTRNRAGKTSVIEIIHFLAGADVKTDSVFRLDALANAVFGMTFDLDGEKTTAERSVKEKSKIDVFGTGVLKGESRLSNNDWVTVLGDKMFGLHNLSSSRDRVPTFRSLFSYFVRRQQYEAFTTPEKNASMQQIGDYQVALLYLLGLDWQIASDWQTVRDREKTLKEIKKAAKAGDFGNLIGKASELRTQLAVAEADLAEMRSQMASFRVLPQYTNLEIEADQLTDRINELSNANIIDTGISHDLENSMRAESPPPLDELERIYSEAGISLPGLALKRYAEVRSFHESVIRNRRDYLASELDAAKRRIADRELEKQRFDERRSVIMNLLNSHGAFEQFSRLQGEIARKEADVEALRQRFAAAEQIEGTKNELEIERNHLTIRLRRDFSEQKTRLDEAIIAFEEISKRLYQSAGSMVIEDSANGPQFKFPMQGNRSKGIKNMQIFCFDMMLMRLCAERNMGPGFLIHDSHLYDGVDGRQVISALKVGAETAEELGFQYIVTLNQDDAYKETIDGFNLAKHVLPIGLTDAQEDGGLFGFRF